MEKERLRIPSDSSSGSSSHGATSPNLASLHTGKPAYVLKNNLGPPPNSPANFSPLLPPSSPYSLPPPPGLPHPGLGGMYQMPSCPSTSYQNINYSSGMPGSMGNHSHMTSRFPPVQPQPVAAGQFEFINGYGVQNSMLQQTQTNSPPPGYNYFGNSHHTPQSCPPHQTSQSHACGPLNSSHHVAYNQQNQSGEPNDLEKHLKRILSSSNMPGMYEKTCFGGRDFMSLQSHLSPQDDLCSGILPGHLQKDEKLNSASVDGVMNPIIENLVGSMSMCNGTYTHFGPSIPLTNKLQNGQVDILSNETHMDSHSGCLESGKALFSKVAVTCASNEMKDSTENMFGIPAVGVKQQPVYQLGIEPNQQDTTHESRFFALENVNSSEPGMHPRTSSPREPAESSSRPQTPGKPSYLEVLTKAGFKNQQSGPSSRKISSTSSSPVQSSFTATDNIPSLTHRKSVEYFVGPATSSTPSSSCPSASSSPATKPRNMTSGMKGKENVSGAALKQANVSKNSPSNSPTHSTNQNQLPKGKSMQNTNIGTIGSERKVLASQNSTSSNTKSNSKAIRNGKLTGDKSFELGDGNLDGGECGWKTYTSRGRNNNLNSVGNKNSQKRTSNGHCSPEPPVASNVASFDDEEEDMDEGKQGSNDDAVTEKRPASATVGTSGTSSSVTHSRKQREKEKQRSKKEDRNCVSRRLEILVYMWLTHMISALTWLWSLITDVASLSASLVASLMQDFFLWTKTKVFPSITHRVARIQKEICQVCHNGWHNWKTKVMSLFSREAPKPKKTTEDNSSSSPGSRSDENILSLLGPERNIVLPANGDEALKRLLSVKGQDPYSILGVRSDCSDETIRRYYKRQAVLVHPDKNLIVGAEEAFKILARAFEMVGDPIKRAEYHQKLMEAQAKEKFCGEIGNLLEQLRKKMEAASSTIRCTKCNSRHKKNMTDRPLFAARYCSQCRIHHGAREGELWAERGGWFGISWNYFACMDAHVWEINEWARCQKTNLKHIKADAHCVMYRLVAGGNNHQNHHNQHCHGNGTAFEEGAGSEADEWDSLINNLYKAPAGSSFGKSTGVPGKAGCCNATGLNNNGTASNNQAAGRRRKGKRNK